MSAAGFSGLGGPKYLCVWVNVWNPDVAADGLMVNVSICGPAPSPQSTSSPYVSRPGSLKSQEIVVSPLMLTSVAKNVGSSVSVALTFSTHTSNVSTVTPPSSSRTVTVTVYTPLST